MFVLSLGWIQIGRLKILGRAGALPRTRLSSKACTHANCPCVIASGIVRHQIRCRGKRKTLFSGRTRTALWWTGPGMLPVTLQLLGVVDQRRLRFGRCTEYPTVFVVHLLLEMNHTSWFLGPFESKSAVRVQQLLSLSTIKEMQKVKTSDCILKKLR